MNAWKLKKKKLKGRNFIKCWKKNPRMCYNYDSFILDTHFWNDMIKLTVQKSAYVNIL